MHPSFLHPITHIWRYSESFLPITYGRCCNMLRLWLFIFTPNNDSLINPFLESIVIPSSFLPIIAHKNLVITILQRKHWRLLVACTHASVTRQNGPQLWKIRRPVCVVTFSPHLGFISLVFKSDSEGGPLVSSAFLSLHISSFRSSCTKV